MEIQVYSSKAPKTQKGTQRQNKTKPKERSKSKQRMTKRKQNKKKRMQKQKWKKWTRRYPFLAVRNYWTGKIEKDAEPWLCDDGGGGIPVGWAKRFGRELSEDLRAELLKHGALNEMYIVDAKEKFGELRVYTGNEPENSDVDRIIENYVQISRTVCTQCGRMDCHTVNLGGWIEPMCENCYNKMSVVKEYKDAITSKDNITHDFYEITKFGKDKKETKKIDISGIVKRLRTKKG